MLSKTIFVVLLTFAFLSWKSQAFLPLPLRTTKTTVVSTLRGSANLLPEDYDSRAEAFGFDSATQIQNALKQAGSVLLDVRTKVEIIFQGEIDHPVHAYSSCSPSACPELETKPQSILPDKDVPIVIHCASGKRAMKAKEVLQNQGYTNVLNGGGYKDMKAILGK